MKRKTMLIVFGICCFVIYSANFAAAAIGCSTLKITSVNATMVWVKNLGSACVDPISSASWATGQTRGFVYDTNKTDRLMAVTLTALSLDKTVWMYVGDTVSNSTVYNISVDN